MSTSPARNLRYPGLALAVSLVLPGCAAARHTTTASRPDPIPFYTELNQALNRMTLAEAVDKWGRPSQMYWQNHAITAIWDPLPNGSAPPEPMALRLTFDEHTDRLLRWTYYRG